MDFWLFLFIVGTIVLVVRILLWAIGTHTMPFRCPRCSFGGDDDLAGRHDPWYVAYRGDSYRCRQCATWFKEHPNGSLVEDRS